MKRNGVVVFLFLFLAFSTFANSSLTADKTLISVYDAKPLDHQVRQTNIPAVKPQHIIHQWDGELDLVGDTLVVGDSYYNAQHNGTIGRMLGMFPDEMTIGNDTYDHVVFFTWMDKPTPATDVHIKFNRAFVNGEGSMVTEFDHGGMQVDGVNVAAYVTLGMDDVNGLAYPAYHGGNDGNSMGIRFSDELVNLFPGVFTDFQVPGVEGNEQFWPRVVFSPATDYLHIVSTENPPVADDESHLTAPQDIYYSRHLHTMEDDQSDFEVEDQVLVTDLGRNISADIAVSDDGDRVAIGQTISRDYLDPDVLPADYTQYNQDIYIWISEDGGETWNFDNPLNLTNFIYPDLDLLPDSIAACKDTLRAYADCNVYFDHNDVLHVAFTAVGYFEVKGTIYGRHSMIYHWDEESDVFTMISDGAHGHLTYNPGSWQRSRQRPNMYQDPATGVLWCVFNGYGWNGDTNPEDSTDISDINQGNAEVYIAASPPNSDAGDWYGRLWTKEVNITQSKWYGDQPAGAGDCRSECDPSIALNNDGAYLNIFYIQDYQGGNARQDEGEYTLNDAVWHRLSKGGMLDLFDEQGSGDENNIGWVANYPMHIDETQHWTDETYGYVWAHEAWGADDQDPFYRGLVPTGSVHDKDQLLPGEFSLKQNYPNPFNPTTRLEFSLKRKGAVKLAIYDVLGRRVGVLMNRVMHSGQHSVTFDGSHLASGIYFVKLSSGEAVHTRKMVLMK